MLHRVALIQWSHDHSSLGLSNSKGKNKTKHIKHSKVVHMIGMLNSKSSENVQYIEMFFHYSLKIIIFLFIFLTLTHENQTLRPKPSCDMLIHIWICAVNGNLRVAAEGKIFWNGFGKKWGWVNSDRFLGWTNPLMPLLCVDFLSEGLILIRV